MIGMEKRKSHRPMSIMKRIFNYDIVDLVKMFIFNSIIPKNVCTLHETDISSKL